MKKIPIIESYWVVDNLLLAGEYPGSFEVENTRRKIDSFLDHGVHSFIDLTEADELVPYEPVLKEEAKIYGVVPVHQRFPIRDHTVPTADGMASILDAIDAEVDSGRAVYVHCWGGIGRTGIVVGCYLVRHGLSNEQAVERVNQLYQTRPRNPIFPRSPESRQQVNFILNWWEDPERLKRGRKYCEG